MRLITPYGITIIAANAVDLVTQMRASDAEFSLNNALYMHALVVKIAQACGIEVPWDTEGHFLEGLAHAGLAAMILREGDYL